MPIKEQIPKFLPDHGGIATIKKVHPNAEIDVEMEI